MADEAERVPEGEIYVRTLAMPDALNAYGDVFGGWLLSQMDIACGMAARDYTRGRAVTVAVDAMHFHKPMHLGEILACHVVVRRMGRTSITFHVEAWVYRPASSIRELITEGDYVFVAIDEDRKPREIPRG